MNMKRFIEDFSEVEKYERYNMVGENINDIIDFMLDKNKDNALRERAVKLITSKKFAKTLKKVVKKREYDISLNLISVLSSLLADMEFDNDEEGKSDDKDKEVQDSFFYIIETMMEKKVKKICNKTGLPKQVIINLVLECPESLEEAPTGRMYYFINKLIKKFYMIPSIVAKSDETIDYTNIDQFIKVVKLLIGASKIKNFAINVLLEPNKRMESITSEQAPVYNLLTDMALNILNDIKKKDEIKETIEKLYIKQRIYADSKDYKDTKRRLSLLMIDGEKYPKLSKAIKELASNEKNKKYLE